MSSTLRPGPALGRNRPVRAFGQHPRAAARRLFGLVDGRSQAKNGPQPGVAEPTTPVSLTLNVQVHKGDLTTGTDELSSRDETDRVISLHPPGPLHSTARAGGAAAVTVKGTHPSGSAQVTWRHAGQLLAIWTFTIELD